jgi:uncharacterized protein YecA (UPF0149 family)
MDPYEFIKDRYDWSYDDLDRLRDAMADLPMIDFENIIDLMESYSEHKLEKKEKELEDVRYELSEANEMIIDLEETLDGLK